MGIFCDFMYHCIGKKMKKYVSLQGYIVADRGIKT